MAFVVGGEHGMVTGAWKRKRMSKLNENGVIVEFVKVGSYVKVSAVDPVSMIEVSIVGNPMSGEAMLTRTAIRKLKYVMEKRGK